MADYVENLCEAMEIIAQKQIEQVSFDITLEATVIDASKAKEGKYIVSTGNASFLAYSTETGYRNDDAVMVTVPQGDYDKQKIIVGKQVGNSNTPLIYKSPFQELVNVTNNLITGHVEPQAFWANGPTHNWNADVQSFWESQCFTNEPEAIYGDTESSENPTPIMSEDTQNMEDEIGKTKIALIWENTEDFGISESRYTRLGLKADFSTWLSDYNTAFGNYGLAVVLIFANADSSGRFGRFVTFDSSEFFGDVYNFESYFTQEILFDISEFVDYQLKRIQLYAYQRNNFTDEKGVPIYEQSVFADDSGPNDIIPNIFIKDPYLCLGLPTSDFNADIAEIVTESSSAYYIRSSDKKRKPEDDFDLDLNNTIYNGLVKRQDNLKKVLIEIENSDDTAEQKAERCAAVIRQAKNIYTQAMNTFEASYNLALEEAESNIHLTAEQKQKKIENINSKYEELYSLYITFDPDLLNQESEEPEPSSREEESIEEIITLTEDEQRFQDNLKVLNLRWIHKDAENDIIKTVEEGELPPGYHIYWYRYILGAPSTDYFVGTNWERYYGMCPTPNKNGDYTYPNRDLYEKELAKLSNPRDEDIEALRNQYLNVDLATDHIENIEFQPNINRSKEVLKAIIVKEESNYGFQDDDHDYSSLRLVASTPSITFENQSDSVSKATLLVASALAIRFDDDERGHYFLYNRANKIAKEEDKEYRTLTAVFDIEENGLYRKPPLRRPYSSIKWIFPASRTMITPLIIEGIKTKEINSSLFNAENDYTYQFGNCLIQYVNDDNGDFYEISDLTTDDTESPLVSVAYKINEMLNRNANRNTVYLEVIKEGQFYNAQAQMIFDTAGTSGSPYTLVVLWDDNQNAFDINQDELYGQVYLYDQNGDVVELFENGEYKFKWYKARVDGVEFPPQLETRDLYYPVKNSALTLLKERASSNGAQNDIQIKYALDPLESAQYYYYDVITKKFEETTYDSQKLLYRKREVDNSNDDCYILDFKPFDETVKGSPYGVIEGTKTRKFYHANGGDKRAFIKYNDTYIIDPWDKYIETETYYEPIYTGEKNYQHDMALQVEAIKSNNKKGRFVIRKGKNTQNQLIKPNINTDLYILEVKLVNFGEYDLTARFPLALKNSDIIPEGISADNYTKIFTIDNIEGATDVRYDTSGGTDFDKNPYRIFMKTAIITDNNNISYKSLKSGHGKDSFATWELEFEQEYSPDEAFLPKLVESIEDNSSTNFLAKKLMDKLYQKDSIYFVLYILDQLLTKNPPWISTNDNITVLSNNMTRQAISQNFNYLLYGTSDLENFRSELETHPEELEELDNKLQIILNNSTEDQIYEFIEVLKQWGSFNSTSSSKLYKPLLLPPNIYFKDAPLYGVKCILTKDLDTQTFVNGQPRTKTITKGTVLWNQAIYVYQDNYPSTTLNQWNGKDIVTDEESGIISAKGFSAGKKEKDNTFTGVVLGDWSKTDSDIVMTQQTGVYGFHHGAMAYALKDDGTAFFGKDGSGRIYFNGQNAQIYSANWTLPIPITIEGENNTEIPIGKYKQRQEGMILDVNDGLIHLKYSDINNHVNETILKPGYFKVTTNKTFDGRVKEDEIIDLIDIEPGKQILQSANYSTSVSEGGQYGGYGFKMDLFNGKIQLFDVNLQIAQKYNQQQEGNDGHLQINNEKEYPFELGSTSRMLKIDWHGNLIMNGNLTVGGTFTANRIQLTNDHQSDYDIEGKLIRASSKLLAHSIECSQGGITCSTEGGSEIAGRFKCWADLNCNGWNINNCNVLHCGQLYIKYNDVSYDVKVRNDGVLTII